MHLELNVVLFKRPWVILPNGKDISFEGSLLEIQNNGLMLTAVARKMHIFSIHFEWKIIFLKFNYAKCM